MTDDIIKRAEAVLEGVMPGPWTWETESGEWPDHSLIAGNGDCVLWWDFDLGFRFNHENDARFIAAARDLIPDLLTAHKAALARVQGLEGIIAMMDAVTPRADKTCDEPGITLSEACRRQIADLTKKDEANG
jgi:diadenosine tetraphosphatase ApaH/serine/threonine PP2A family protein phosphatase